MKTPVMTEKKRSLLFAVLALVSFFACFIFAPLGGFMVWIFGGAFVYFVFMAIYSLVSAKSQEYGKARPRYDTRQEDIKTYIATQKPILISVFLAGLLLVIAILMMVL